MANFLTKGPTRLFSIKAGADADLLEIIPPAFPMIEIKDDANDDTWIHVGKFANNIVGRRGWVLRADLEDTDAPKPNPDIEIDIFTQETITVEFVFNKKDDTPPFLADADYLLAWANIETGIKNVDDLGPLRDGIGPFGFTTAEWDDFLNSGSAPPGFDPFDIGSPLHQVDCAAWMMSRDARQLSTFQAAGGTGGAANPYLPRLGELLRCRLIGAQRTFEMQQKLKAEQGDQLLPDFLAASGMPQNDIPALLEYRRRFMRTGGASDGDPLTLKGFHDKCAEILNEELTAAFGLIKQYAPETIETAATPAVAPWFALAQTELASGISESDAAGQARIAQYFTATGTQGTFATPWCGAFVAWCMDQAGGAAQASYQAFRNTAAAAASWRQWGDVELNLKGNPPVGAIVLLSPSRETDDISHVGFFKSYDDGARKVTVLGGNQSNKVCEIPFKAADVVAIRWMSTMAPAGAVTISAGAPIPAGREPMATIIMDEFAAAGYGRIQQIAALANAIKESKLDSVAQGDGGASIGLFQCNMRRGEGVGHTIENLRNPTYNTKVIIKAAKRYGSFADAKTIDRAVEVFVSSVERPKDTSGEIKERRAIAHKLDALLP